MKPYNRNKSYKDSFIYKLKESKPGLDKKIFEIIYGK